MLCKKPHEKRVIKREIANSVKGLKMAFFFAKQQRGTKGNYSKMADFLGKLWKVEKIGNKSRIIA